MDRRSYLTNGRSAVLAEEIILEEFSKTVAQAKLENYVLEGKRL